MDPLYSKCSISHTLDLFSSVFHVCTPAGGCSGQKILNDPDANVVAHSIQLPVHIVDVLIVSKQLSNQSAVG